MYNSYGIRHDQYAELAHYGVKGMKWGVRRRLDNTKATIKGRYNNRIDYLNREENITRIRRREQFTAVKNVRNTGLKKAALDVTKAGANASIARNASELAYLDRKRELMGKMSVTKAVMHIPEKQRGVVENVYGLEGAARIGERMAKGSSLKKAIAKEEARRYAIKKAMAAAAGTAMLARDPAVQAFAKAGFEAATGKRTKNVMRVPLTNYDTIRLSPSDFSVVSETIRRKR